MTPFTYDGNISQLDLPGLDLWYYPYANLILDRGIFDPVHSIRYRVVVECYV